MEAGGEACNAQDAHRVLAEGLGDVPQHLAPQVQLAAEGVDERAVLGLRDRVDGEVAGRGPPPA